jgi:hypothetical protein
MYKVDVEGFQSEIVSYERELAGDSVVTTADFYLFDVNKRDKIRIGLPSAPAFLGVGFYTFENCPKAYHVKYHRGYKTRELIEVDLENGATRTVLVESYPKTFVDLYTETFELMYDRGEFIWRSEQDGWSQLYLYDLKTGGLESDHQRETITFTGWSMSMLLREGCGSRRGELIPTATLTLNTFTRLTSMVKT